MSRTIPEGHTLVASWESVRGAHWVDVTRGPYGYSYSGNGCDGSLGNMDESAALAHVGRMVASGYFLPDSAKSHMLRTFPAHEVVPVIR